MKKKLLFTSVLVATFSACAAAAVDKATRQYHAVSGQVELGDSRDCVLAMLEPSQEELSDSQKKGCEKYLEEDVLVEIYYFLSNPLADGLSTNEEFTPYVFHDGTLVRIGWAILGGPKTQAQRRQGSTVIVNSSPSYIPPAPPVPPLVWSRQQRG